MSHRERKIAIENHSSNVSRSRLSGSLKNIMCIILHEGYMPINEFFLRACYHFGGFKIRSLFCHAGLLKRVFYGIESWP